MILYTPTQAELELAARAKSETAKLSFLVLLKTFQCLGYFIVLGEVPRCIVEHIGHNRGMLIVPEMPAEYDQSGTRRRHVFLIRNYLHVRSFDRTGQALLASCVRLAAVKMEDLADIVNVAIEELVRGSFELSSFSTLHKEAKLGRTEVNFRFYQRVRDVIGGNGRTAIDTLLSESGSQSRKTRWDSLKQDARSPTLTHLRNMLQRQ